MTRPRNFQLPSFEERQKRTMGGSDLGGLNRPNPYFDNPLVNRESNYFARTFTGPRRPTPTVAPIPSAIHEITGRHAGAYIPESEGAHVAPGRRMKQPTPVSPSPQPAVASPRVLTPGRHRAETRADRIRSALRLAG